MRGEPCRCSRTSWPGTAAARARHPRRRRRPDLRRRPGRAAHLDGRALGDWVATRGAGSRSRSRRSGTTHLTSRPRPRSVSARGPERRAEAGAERARRRSSSCSGTPPPAPSQTRRSARRRGGGGGRRSPPAPTVRALSLPIRSADSARAASVLDLTGARLCARRPPLPRSAASTTTVLVRRAARRSGTRFSQARCGHGFFFRKVDHQLSPRARRREPAGALLSSSGPPPIWVRLASAPSPRSSTPRRGSRRALPGAGLGQVAESLRPPIEDAGWRRTGIGSRSAGWPPGSLTRQQKKRNRLADIRHPRSLERVPAVAGAGRRAPAVPSVRSDPRGAEPEGSPDTCGHTFASVRALPRCRSTWLVSHHNNFRPAADDLRPAAHGGRPEELAAAKERFASTRYHDSETLHAALERHRRTPEVDRLEGGCALHRARRTDGISTARCSRSSSFARRSGYREMRAQPHRMELADAGCASLLQSGNAWFPAPSICGARDVAVEARFEEARSADGDAFHSGGLLRIRGCYVGALCSFPPRAASRTARTANRVVQGPIAWPMPTVTCLGGKQRHHGGLRPPQARRSPAVSPFSSCPCRPLRCATTARSPPW